MILFSLSKTQSSLIVKMVTLSAIDNKKLSKILSKRFERSIS